MTYVANVCETTTYAFDLESQNEYFMRRLNMRAFIPIKQKVWNILGLVYQSM